MDDYFVWFPHSNSFHFSTWLELPTRISGHKKRAESISEFGPVWKRPAPLGKLAAKMWSVRNVFFSCAVFRFEHLCFLSSCPPFIQSPGPKFRVDRKLNMLVQAFSFLIRFSISILAVPQNIEQAVNAFVFGHGRGGNNPYLKQIPIYSGRYFALLFKPLDLVLGDCPGVPYGSFVAGAITDACCRQPALYEIINELYHASPFPWFACFRYCDLYELPLRQSCWSLWTWASILMAPSFWSHLPSQFFCRSILAGRSIRFRPM